jgi:hypothetical protein
MRPQDRGLHIPVKEKMSADPAPDDDESHDRGDEDTPEPGHLLNAGDRLR